MTDHPLKSSHGARALLSEDDAKAARQYADALLGAAEKENAVEEALADLEAIRDEILAPNPKLAELFASFRVPTAEKDRIVSELLDGRISDVALRFVRVVNRHGRLGLLAAIADEARRLWDERHRRIPVLVRSAAPLDEERTEELKRRVSAMTGGATPLLEVTTDPSLLGGLIVQIGDQVYDASVRNRLEQVRKRLIEGKTHEIQKRRDQFSHSA